MNIPVGSIVLLGFVRSVMDEQVERYLVRRLGERDGVAPGHPMLDATFAIFYTADTLDSTPRYLDRLYEVKLDSNPFLDPQHWHFTVTKTAHPWADLHWALDPFIGCGERFGEPRMGVVGSDKLVVGFGDDAPPPSPGKSSLRKPEPRGQRRIRFS